MNQKMPPVAMRAGTPNKIQINVNPGDLTFVECKCGCSAFINGRKIGKISAMHPQNPTGKAAYVDVGVAICAKCKRILPNNP